jgi:hypothetical protein
VADRYTREDNRSYCDIHGQDYKEVNSVTKRWTERELIDDGEEVHHGFLCGTTSKVSRNHWERVKHSLEVVTYECSRCNKKTIREENEK